MTRCACDSFVMSRPSAQCLSAERLFTAEASSSCYEANSRRVSEWPVPRRRKRALRQPALSRWAKAMPPLWQYLARLSKKAVESIAAPKGHGPGPCWLFPLQTGRFQGTSGRGHDRHCGPQASRPVMVCEGHAPVGPVLLASAKKRTGVTASTAASEPYSSSTVQSKYSGSNTDRSVNLAHSPSEAPFGFTG